MIMPLKERVDLDLCVAVSKYNEYTSVRARFIDNQNKLLPYLWIGWNVYPLIQEERLDGDNLYGIAQPDFC
jgi:hypothetical protein